MSYSKNTWETGDVITAVKLNNIEDGIASGGVLVVNASYDSQEDVTVLDKTWQEIHDAPMAVICQIDAQDMKHMSYISAVGVNDELYGVAGFAVSDGLFSSFVYTATSADGYPTDDDK